MNAIQNCFQILYSVNIFEYIISACIIHALLVPCIKTLDGNVLTDLIKTKITFEGRRNGWDFRQSKRTFTFWHILSFDYVFVSPYFAMKSVGKILPNATLFCVCFLLHSQNRKTLKYILNV